MKLQLKNLNKDLAKFYIQKRILNIFLLGIISGFPWVLIGSSLSLWLKEDGLSRSAIGWAGLIFAVYAVNYLWAPFIDKIKIPWLTNKIGHRKSWIFFMQSMICICLIFWIFCEPSIQLKLIVFIGLLIAICSATQDVTIDALRIEQIGFSERKAMAAGASIAVVGWWTGYKLGGFISLSVSEYFENLGYENYWQITFLFLFFLILILNFCLLSIKEESFQKKEIEHKKFQKKIIDKFNFNSKFSFFIAWLYSTIVAPIVVFFKKNGISIGFGLLAFILLFKVGEAFLGRMSVIFYKEIGFSKFDIGLFSKGVGWITTISFTLLGGILTIKVGLLRAVFLSGILMATTNLLFSILFWSEKSYFLFLTAVILDDIAASFATVAFVAFISLLVDRNYTATQYALLASIGTIGRTTLASSSGSLVDYLNGDWGIFFILTTLMVIPSLILLYFLRKNIFK